MFKRVVEFNYNYGVIPSMDIHFQPNGLEDKSKVEFCLKLIREEVAELAEAISQNDFVEMIDALVDILYVVYGMCCRIGYTPVADTSLATNGVVNTEIITENSELVHYYLARIQAELRKLENTSDMSDAIDALESIVSYVRAMTAITGVSLEDAFTLVHNNNMSKMCATEADAIKSVQSYQTPDSIYTTPSYRKTPGGMYIIYNQETHKILKSVTYKPVDLKPVCL